MRAFIALVLCAALSWASSAQASSSGLKLRLDLEVIADAAGLVAAIRAPALKMTAGVGAILPMLQGLPSAPHEALPAHYAWVERDTRSFWFSAGAGAVTTLGTHIIVGLPSLFFASSALGPMLDAGSPGAFAAGIGLFTAYTLLESGLSSLVAMLVFDSMSETYESRYLTGFFGHFAGAMASTAVTSLTVGFGLLALHGSLRLADFTGGAGYRNLEIFSLLGAMPAVVMAATALIAVPAMTTSWALSAGATARPGYIIDDRWREPTVAERSEDPSRRRRDEDRVATIGLPIALP